MKKPAALLLLALVALAGAAPARAGKKPKPPVAAAPVEDPALAEKKARAQRLVGEGRGFFDKSSFAEAADKFEEAYKLFPVPKMLYNLGITFDALRREDRATCALERFIAEVPDADAALRKDSEERLVRLRKAIGRVQVEAPPGAALFVDGEERGTTPAAAALCVAPGTHRVLASEDGQNPVSLDVNVRAGTTLRVALDPTAGSSKLLSDSGAAAAAAVVAAAPPAPAPVSAPSVDRGSTPAWKKGWFWGVIGVVAVGAAVGIVLATRPPDVTPPAADFGPVKVFQ